MYQAISFLSNENNVKQQPVKTNKTSFDISDAFLHAYKR